MNKQKLQTNPFKQKSDHMKKKYGSDQNNNNNNRNGKNAMSNVIQKHNSRYAQPIFNCSAPLKSCLKINDKSKGGKYTICLIE